MRRYLTCISYVLVASNCYAIEPFLNKPLDSVTVTQGVYYTPPSPKAGCGEDIAEGARAADCLVHNAIDFRATSGAIVRAAAPGWAISSEGGGLDRFVLIYHDNGYSTLYAHLSKTNISNRSYDQFRSMNLAEDRAQMVKVEAGDEIGRSGTGWGTDHLHFELSKNDQHNWPAHVAGKMDPYDLYGMVAVYPKNPHYDGCGLGSLWKKSAELCLNSAGTDLNSKQSVEIGEISAADALRIIAQERPGFRKQRVAELAPMLDVPLPVEQIRVIAGTPSDRWYLANLQALEKSLTPQISAQDGLRLLHGLEDSRYHETLKYVVAHLPAVVSPELIRRLAGDQGNRWFSSNLLNLLRFLPKRVSGQQVIMLLHSLDNMSRQRVGRTLSTLIYGPITPEELRQIGGEPSASAFEPLVSEYYANLSLPISTDQLLEVLTGTTPAARRKIERLLIPLTKSSR